MKKIGRILLIVLVVLIVLFAIIAIAGPPWVRRTAEKSFPQIDGELQVAGLDGPVDIYRDSFGIPHIYAASQHDIFFVQGYVHAQDRFWQMDFWRHQGAGRLSELLGEATLDTDKFLRTLGWERVARQELDLLDDQSRFILEAYTEGVNAYLADHTGSALALEYAFLPIVNRGYEPAPWTMLNSLTWAKAMAWDLRRNLDTEIDRAMLLKDLTPEQVADLFPPYPEDRPVIVPDYANSQSSSSVHHSPFTIHHSQLFETLHTQLSTLPFLTRGFDGIGSNSWAVSGELTDTGMPLLANDPHLGAQMPSIWYEVGLHCVPKTDDCALDVAGFSFAGVPGVVIGHNDRIAWGFTNVGPDVMDLYIEKVNPENPNQYEFQGEWVDMDIVTEQIQVAGGETVEHTVRLTQHGPVITEDYGLETFAEDVGSDVTVPENYALAVRWTALEPTCIFCSIWKFNLAQNWDDFRTAAQEFVVPAQNLLYADVDGNIGYQMPGNIPIRGEGHDGMLPVPGWTGEYEWSGYIPFAELPFSFNPPEGYIATANNAVVGPDYPYLITYQWSYGYRAQRIVDLLEGATGPIDIPFIQQMQGDNMELMAEVLLPVLIDIPMEDPDLEQPRALLSGWDGHLNMDSAPAALYMAFWRNLLEATFSDDLPEFYGVGVDSGAKEIMRKLVDDPDSAWWDNVTTTEVETRDDILAAAFAAGYKEIRDLQGNDPADWAWGDLHTLTYYNQVMSSFPFIDKAFNRGPYPTAGGSAIVNATGWDADDPFEVDWLPSMRMIVDLGDLTNSLTVNTSGQSGHPYHPHYIDQPDLWRNIQYHPMLWDRAKIEVDAEGHLRLLP